MTAAALWLARPFFTGRLIGSGDAWWYVNMLRDFLQQVRAGIFPIWTGQTEFAFNGAVYPLRAAPFFQHLGMLLDLLTGRRLDAFALQHAVVVVTLFATVHLAYFSLCRLAPGKRNEAAVFAGLYTACPGILGLATSMDLYMSYVATPFLPLITCGLVLSLGFPSSVSAPPANERTGLCMAVTGLALTWYAHAPLAAWLTLIATAILAIRLALRWHDRRAWVDTVGSGLLFVGLVAGVFASVASLRSGDSAGLIPYGIKREMIIAALRDAFPHCLLPLRVPAVSLGDLQLGYALWAALGAGCAASLLAKQRRFLLLAAPAAVVVIFLLPIPGVTAWLWHTIPEGLARLTYYWPMHRLCPMLAAFALPLGMLAAIAWAPKVPRQMLVSLALLAVAWSAWESAKLIETARVRTAGWPETLGKRRPENCPLMNHAYGLSLALPPYFSDGVMDPCFELRVLGGPGNRIILQDNARAALNASDAPWREFAVALDANPGVWNLSPSLMLQPGRRHLLELDCLGQKRAGMLQIEGTEFFRQYRLPASGQPLAFGSERSAAHWLSLWTTADHPVEIHIRFIPDPDSAAVLSRPFGRFRWSMVDPSSLPLRIDSLLPLKLTVALDQPGLLETFRMHFPGYRATVDGKATSVERSPSGLVAIRLPAGRHVIAIDYSPPWAVDGASTLCATVWLVGIAGIVMRRFRRRIICPRVGGRSQVI